MSAQRKCRSPTRVPKVQRQSSRSELETGGKGAHQKSHRATPMLPVRGPKAEVSRRGPVQVVDGEPSTTCAVERIVRSTVSQGASFCHSHHDAARPSKAKTRPHRSRTGETPAVRRTSGKNARSKLVHQRATAVREEPKRNHRPRESTNKSSEEGRSQDRDT